MSLQDEGRVSQTARGFADHFDDDMPVGQVVGSHNRAGVIRGGTDVENIISIDHGALRVQPPLQPGWGRTGIAYGPYRRVNGLAFGINILNGHNTSQTGDLIVSLPKRVLRWMRGSGADAAHLRLARWLFKGDKRIQTRQLRRWLWIDKHHKNGQGPAIDENLALGWFPNPKPADPLNEGNAFVVHATGANNGELWARIGGRTPAVVRSLQNIPLYYLVVLRDSGAVYYVSSLPSANGLAGYPLMRPLAIDPFEKTKNVYGAFYQSVLGQIGFRVDTRVYDLQVEQLPAFGNWYGSAHAADRLEGHGPLSGTAAETGGNWSLYKGGYQRTPDGISPKTQDNLATVDPGQVSGLIHVMFENDDVFENDAGAEAGLLWRVQDEANYWLLQIDTHGCRLKRQLDGDWRTIAIDDSYTAQPRATNAVQIVDDGQIFSLYLNGHPLFDDWFSSERLASATGIGLQAKNTPDTFRFREFEAHPRTIPWPAEFDFQEPWNRKGTHVVVADDFDGPASDLDGRTTTSGDGLWRKVMGNGIFELTGKGSAKVRGNAETPNSNRTAYTVEWTEPNFADLQIDITPPGSDRGQLEMGRSGLIFWQDASNYIIINTWLDDVYEGASISSFFYLRGYEDLFDAVWTNIGQRIHWGTPSTLRVAFDGLNYTTFVDGEPVLYRALTDVYPDCSPLAIRRVGIVANWEWGNDSGSIFDHFVARV